MHQKTQTLDHTEAEVGDRTRGEQEADMDMAGMGRQASQGTAWGLVVADSTSAATVVEEGGHGNEESEMGVESQKGLENLAGYFASSQDFCSYQVHCSASWTAQSPQTTTALPPKTLIREMVSNGEELIWYSYWNNEIISNNM